MYQTEDKIYEFGPFRLDLRLRRLYHGEEHIQLRPKAFELLQLLVEHAGVLVERELIQQKIWPSQIVEEGNLTQHIYQLRKALGGSQKSPEYILTLPGRGYLFNQKVHLTGQALETSLPDNLPGDGMEAAAKVDPVGDDQLEWTGRAAGGRRIRPLLLWGGILLSLTIGGIVLALYWRGRLAGSGPAPSGVVVPAIVSLVTFPGEEADLAFSPDGQYLAFSAVGETQGNRDIYVKAVDRGETWRVTTHADKDTQPVWSPDGTRIAFLRTADRFGEPYRLMVIPVRGGAEQEIGQVTGGLGWSPDGKYLSVSISQGVGRPTSLCLLSADGQERKLLNTPPPNVYDTLQQFSPDGTRIAFVRWRSTGNADLFVYTIATRELAQLSTDETPIHDLEWAADSASVYVVSRRTGNNRLWSFSIFGGGAVEIALVPQGIKSFSISPDEGQLVFTQPINDTQIDILQQTGGEGMAARRFCAVNSSRADDTPRFSPDRSRLAFVSARSGYDEIWVANADCTNVRQVTKLRQQFLGSPRWSPDGQWLVFDRTVKDNTDIFVIRVDGTDLRQLTSDPAVEAMPSWSGNGEWIYFSSNRTSIPQIYRVPAKGGEVIPVTLSQGLESIESEDGASLYFTNGNQLWRKDLQRGEESAIPELASVPIGRYWDLSSETIFYISQEPADRLVIHTFDLKRRTMGQLFELSGTLSRWVPGISVARGGNLIAIGYVSNSYGDINLIKGWL